MTEQHNQFENVIRKLYEVISFPENGAPDWEGMKALFFPWARITRITPEAIDELDLNGFMDMVSEYIESGVFTSFYEIETARRVEFFGAVAHVLSSYETKCNPEAINVLGRGINSIQLVWKNGKWLIASLLWDEGSRKSPIVLTHFQNLEVTYA